MAKINELPEAQLLEELREEVSQKASEEGGTVVSKQTSDGYWVETVYR